MITLIREGYVRSARFVAACPWIVAAVVAAEFVQHVAEIRLGMYDNMVQARAMAEAPLRMATGHLKVLALLLLGYGVARFLAFGDSAREATRLEPRAVRLFTGVMAFGLLWLIIGLDGPPLLRAAGMDGRTAGFVIGGISVAGFVLQLLVVPWKIAAALGNADIGFTRSIRLSARHLPWSFAFVVAMTLPPLALHYALFLGAIGLPMAIIWPLALLDAAVVGGLGALLIATEFIVARRIAERNGLALLAPASPAGDVGGSPLIPQQL